MDHWITLEDLADFMDVPTLPLEMGETVITAAESTVRRYLQQHVTFIEDDEEVHDGRNLIHLRLRERPVREVVEVEVDGEVLDESAWFIDGFVLKRIDGATFPYGIANIIVTYDHGWDIAAEGEEIDDSGESDDFNVPGDIRYVTLAMAARRLSLTGNSSTGDVIDGTITQEQIGQYSYSVDATAAALVAGTQGLSVDEMETLEGYRVPAIQR